MFIERKRRKGAVLSLMLALMLVIGGLPFTSLAMDNEEVPADAPQVTEVVPVEEELTVETEEEAMPEGDVEEPVVPAKEPVARAAAVEEGPVADTKAVAAVEMIPVTIENSFYMTEITRNAGYSLDGFDTTIKNNQTGEIYTFAGLGEKVNTYKNGSNRDVAVDPNVSWYRMEVELPKYN